MAVQQGYGKMAGTDALVFAYDTGDAVNSYKGEPTTNYLSAGLNNITAFTAGGWKGANLTQVGTSVFDTPIFSYATEGTSYTYTNDNMLDDDLATLSQQIVTFSLYIRRIEGPATCQIRIYDNNSGYTYQTRSVTTEFTRIEMTKTIGTNPTRIFVMLDNTGGGTYEFHSTQLELNSKATPFVNGTRSATEGLLDLTGNHEVNLVNAGFDSNSEITFDGTDDKIITNYAPRFADFSVCIVFKDEGSNSWGRVVDKGYTSGFFISSYFATYGINHIGCGIIEPSPPHGVALPYDPSGYHFFTSVREGSTQRIYLDGIEQTDTREVSPELLNAETIAFGRWNAADNSQNFNGKLPIVNIYDRALTPVEIQNNFNRYKTRFNIA